MTLLKVEHLSKTYRGAESPSLDDLSLEIPEHGVFGFLGPNGAGKTTTIKILTGLMSPSKGQIFLRGEPMNRRSQEMRSLIGYLGQEPRYYPWMTARELLLMVGGLFGLERRESQKRADELLDLTRLEETGKKRIGAFSGGMVQRLGIAQALMNRSEVLFLDEPVSALDPLGRREILELIGQLRESTTIFMSTHILADVERVCDQVGILKAGKLIALETTEDLRRHHSPSRKELNFADRASRDRTAEWLESREQKVAAGQEDSLGHAVVSLPQEAYQQVRSELLGFISSQGLLLEGVEDRQADLEQVFISLVGEKGDG